MGVRKITVVCGTGRRFVDVDFSDYGKTVDAIRNKWNLTGEFILQATVGEKGDHYDIIDGNDLADFKDTDTLIVRPLSQDATSAGAGQSFIQGAGQIVDDSVPPPSYEQSQQHSQVPCAERRMSVTFEGMRKLVNVDAKSYEKTKNAIRQKFGIEGKFDFQGKLKGQDDYFDIQGDTDIEEIENADALQVQRTESRKKQAADKGRKEKGQKKTTVICDGVRKLVNIDMNSLENTKDTINLKFSIGDDFDIQGKLPGQDEYFDIQDDVDLQDFHDAESFQVRRKVAVPRKVKQCDDESKFQGGQKQAEKKTTVVFEGVRKLVPVDMKSLADTLESIRQRFQIKGDIELCGKLPGSEEHYNIQDDQDLADFKDAVEFVVKLLDRRPQTSPAKEHAFKESITPAMDQPVFTGNPPDHSRTVQPQQTLTQVPIVTTCETKTLLVKFEGRNKKMPIDLDCLRSTRNAIRQKFNLDGDFPGDYKLLAKTKGTGEYFDIDDEKDLGYLGEDDVLLVERVSTHEQSVPGAMAVVPSPSQGLVPQQRTDTVEIRGTSYSTEEQPDSNSALVLAEADDLRANFDIPQLVDKTTVVADCLRLARYGVSGHPDLEEAVGTLLSEVAVMTQKTNSAIIHFRMKAGDILNDLMRAVSYLQDGEEEIAMQNFESIRTNSEFLKEKAVNLTVTLAGQQKKIQGVLNDINTEDKGQDQNSFLNRRKKELDRQVQVARKDVEDSEARVKNIDKETKEAKGRVKAAMDKDGCRHGCHRGICCHGSCPCRPWRSECCYRCCSGGLFCFHSHRRYYWWWGHHHSFHGDEYDKKKRVDAEKELQKKAEEERLQELMERKKLREVESNANEELLKFIKSMETIDPKSQPEYLSAEALRGAKGAIENLIATMQTTISFWGKLTEQCDSIRSTGRVMDNLENKKTRELRKEFMAKRAFKLQAVQYYAMLVALRNMCEVFHRNIKAVETKIQLSMVDNPGVAEAREKIPTLIKDLENKIETIAKAEKARIEAENRESGEIQTRLLGKEYNLN